MHWMLEARYACTTPRRMRQRRPRRVARLQSTCQEEGCAESTLGRLCDAHRDVAQTDARYVILRAGKRKGERCGTRAKGRRLMWSPCAQTSRSEQRCDPQPHDQTLPHAGAA